MQKRSTISLWIFPLVSPPGDRRKLPKIMFSHSLLGNTGLLQGSNFDYSFLTCTNTYHVIFITVELCSYVRWVREFFEHSWVSGQERFMNPTKKNIVIQSPRSCGISRQVFIRFLQQVTSPLGLLRSWLAGTKQTRWACSRSQSETRIWFFPTGQFLLIFASRKHFLLFSLKVSFSWFLLLVVSLSDVETFLVIVQLWDT